MPWRNQQVIDKVRARASREGRAAGPVRGAVAADDRLVHPVRGGEAARRARGQVALVAPRLVSAGEEVDHSTYRALAPKAVLLTAVLNPAVALVALWMGSSASQWQKLPVAAFAAALSGWLLLYAAVRFGWAPALDVRRAHRPGWWLPQLKPLARFGPGSGIGGPGASWASMLSGPGPSAPASSARRSPCGHSRAGVGVLRAAGRRPSVC